MPALKNARHEKYCQAYVRGATAGNATTSYRVAYGKGDRKAASRLRHRDDIGRRIDELQAQVVKIETDATTQAATALGITKQKILGELAKLGFSNMLDYIRVTPDGDPVVDLSRLERDTAAAVQEVVVDSYQDGKGEDAREVKRIRFKLCDKRSALVDLGKHLGLFVDRHVVETPDLKPMKYVDAPPAETFEQWTARRNRELKGAPSPRK